MISKGRITEMELWESDLIDLLEPGYVQFSPDRRGAFVFGAVQGGLDRHDGQASIPFTWMGHDKMDAACGNGDVQPENDSTLTGNTRFHLGDKSSPIAKHCQLLRSLLARLSYSLTL